MPCFVSIHIDIMTPEQAERKAKAERAKKLVCCSFSGALTVPLTLFTARQAEKGQGRPRFVISSPALVASLRFLY
jgi:hypothetical protein